MPARTDTTATILLCLLAAIWVWPGELPASDESSPEFDPLNHAFAVYLGSGYYISNGQKVFVFRVFPKFRLRNEEKHAFGLRMRLNATLGFYDLDLKLGPDFKVPDKLATFSLVPGMEFPIKLYDNWTLMPFLDFGPSIDTQTDETVLVSGVGARSRAEFEDKRHMYVLWNEFVAATNWTTDLEQLNHYNVLRADFEMRGLVRYRVVKRGFDLGLLTRLDFYGDPVVLPKGSESLKFTWKVEVGFTTGPTDRWRQIKLITTPRLGISYWTSSRGVDGLRFVLRFRN